jgi:hypothetical protein
MKIKNDYLKDVTGINHSFDPHEKAALFIE